MQASVEISSASCKAGGHGKAKMHTQGGNACPDSLCVRSSTAFSRYLVP